MERQSESLAFTTPHLAKQASCLYEKIGLFEVEAPVGYGYATDEEEYRKFKDWCVQKVTLKPDEDWQFSDFRSPEIMELGLRALETWKNLAKFRTRYVAMLMPGSPNVVDDLGADVLHSPTEPGSCDSQFARLLLNTAQPAAAADWEQIREFRRDKVAKRDYRGIVYVHQLLKQARSRQEAADMLEGLQKRSTDALLKHGFEIVRLPIQLLVTLGSGSAGVLSGILSGHPAAVGLAAVTAVASTALATLQGLEAIQARTTTEAPALLVKVHAFGEGFEDKKELPSRAAKRHV